MMHNALQAVGLRYLSVGPVDLSVAGGECLALVGSSGSGKSVTLRMLADLVPHEGTCSLGDRSAGDMPASEWRRLVRYIASESGWWAATVAEHFADTKPLAPQLDRLGLDRKLLASSPDTLSTGERQRLAFLRGIEDRPRVLLLDEPTSALDHGSMLALEAMVAEMKQQGIAIVLVSHDREQIERLADRVQQVRP